VGDSWKLGVFAAHALHYADRLAVGGEDADLVVWLTGEVQRDLQVSTTGHIGEKLRRSEALFAELARRGTPYRLYMPADNVANLDEALLAEIGVAPKAVMAVAQAGDLLRDLDLPAANTKSPVRQKGNRRLIGLATSAMILIAAVGAVLLWPEPVEPPPGPRSGPADPLEAAFESNLSAEKIASLLSDRTILGTSVVTDTTFVMNLDGDGKATVALKLPGNSAVMHDEGTWWVEKGKYCYRFSRFGKGLIRCRFIYEEQGRIKIMFLSGRLSDWRITPRKMSELSADGTVDQKPRQSR
jgi:hypothetical protein